LLGVGTVFFLDYMDNTVRRDRILAITGEAPLASVPYIRNGDSPSSTRTARVATIAMGATALLLVAAWAVHRSLESAGYALL